MSEFEGHTAGQVARARARLALRAERAFGLRATAGVRLVPKTEDVEARPEASKPDPESAKGRIPAPTSSDARSEPSPTQASASKSPAKTEKAEPAADLFGGVIEPGQPAATKAGGLPPFAESPPPRGLRIEMLRVLDDTQVKGCTRCDLHKTRTNTVFGEGDPEARLMFVGEGPGENEDESGRPFVGKAGGLLDKMIAGMGLKREDVYIANVVKCRPPGNRTPTTGEADTCTPYLHRQIDLVRPIVIVPLGLSATRHLLSSKLSMSKLRGQWHEWRGIKVLPTYHPAYLLRAYTQANREAVWADLKMVMGELGLKGPGGGKPRG